MKLIYSITYYYGKNKKKNLFEHMKIFKNISETDKIFSVQIMVDSKDEKYFKKVEEEFVSFFSEKGLSNYDIIISYNWGGTILGLWLVYKKFYSMNEEKKDTYISHFEEDFRPINNDWLNKSLIKLENNNYYIGESCDNRKKTGNDDGRLTGKNYINTVRLGSPEVWLDGGYYFSSLEKLKIIHDHIGIFHKGNPNTKYTNLLDGISIGEVGFPTLVYHSQLNFDFLNRGDFFRHYG